MRNPVVRWRLIRGMPLRLPLLPTIALANGLVLGATALVGWDLTRRYDDLSYAAHTEQAQRRADVAVDDLLWRTHFEVVSGVARQIAAGAKLRAAIADSGANTGSMRGEAATPALLADEFGRGAVTLGGIRLLGISLHGPDMALLGQTWAGGSPEAFPRDLFAGAAMRQGLARLGLLQLAWLGGDGPRVTVIAPVGGLRLSGYVALHLDPVPALIGIDKRLGMHVEVVSLDGERSLLQLSDVAAPTGTTSDALLTVHDPTGQALARLKVREDISALSASLRSTRRQAFVRFVAVAGGLSAMSLAAVWFYERRTRRREEAEAAAERERQIERRQAEAKIRHLAHHDSLTGLANRLLFSEKLERALAVAASNGENVGLLCLDLDRFKAVNDTLGHHAGDLLLQQVAKRLRGAVRAGDTVARVGGDEFVILQVGIQQPQGAGALGSRLSEVVTMPFDLDGQQACIATSIGIGIYPQDGTDPETLLQNADLALYRAKAEHRGLSCFYEPAMDARLRERQLLERDLRAAVGTDQLELHYQPLVECGSRGVVGFEALMRWRHPERGAVQPAEFIPIAEETGLIVPLGLWALETACGAAMSWPDHCRIAVNLSPAQFRVVDVPAMVRRVLEQTGLPAGRLELEITEGLLMVDTAQALIDLRALKQLGVRIALDDFGTGYSSLGYLQRFPFDKLKIDKSFVQRLGRDSGADAIIKAVLAMGRSLHLDVTAEGVETVEQLAALSAQACDTVQGYLLGRPMPAPLVRGFLDRSGSLEAGSRTDAGARSGWRAADPVEA